MRTYGQYCPIARASELVAERWTLIIVRNLLNGCTTFTEIRQGAPGIPTALLTQRLKALEKHGVVERHQRSAGRGWLYELTEKGRDLQAVCDAMGQWGARWLEIGPGHIDAAYVLWATTKLIDVDKLPDRTVVVLVELQDRPNERYWIVLRKPNPELCTRAHGYVEDVVVRTDSECLMNIHLRRMAYHDAVRTGRFTLEGPTDLVRGLMTWLRPSPFAEIGGG